MSKRMKKLAAILLSVTLFASQQMCPHVHATVSEAALLTEKAAEKMTAEQTAEDGDPQPQTPESEGNASLQPEFIISSADEWEDFAASCHTDAWSRGRTIRLACDIDLRDRETVCVPYFAGTFDGGGHTVDGASIRTEASQVGLFSVIAGEGTVRNLRVIGAVLPKGRQSGAGGIAGVNHGRIENCTWFGDVNAHTAAGGIAGYNEEDGTIFACTSAGVIQGDSVTGGIAGYNAGLIIDCENKAQVDTVYTDVPFSADDLSVTLDSVLQTGRISTPDNMDQKTDIGGIAGHSIGRIEGCSNHGAVGYEHVGFNIGGICGRSSGLIRLCTNDGEVYGRREVGGIVGQQQPDLKIDFSEGRLGEIDTALDDLQGMIDTALGDTKGYSDSASDILFELSRLTGVAKGDVKTITDSAADRADMEAARANNAAEQIRQSAQDASNATEDISQAVGDVKDYAGKVANSPVDDTDSVSTGLDTIADNYTAIDGTLTNMIVVLDAAATPADSAFYKDVLAMKNALAEAVKGIGGTSSVAAFNALEKDSEARAKFLDGLTQAQLADFNSRIERIQMKLKSYTRSVGGKSRLQKDLDDDTTAGLDKGTLETMIGSLSGPISAVDTAVADMAVKAGQELPESLAQNRGELGQAAEHMNDAMEDLANAFRRLTGFDLSIEGVSPTVRAASGDLYSTIDSMLNSANALNSSLRGAAGGTIGNLRDINDQMGKISDLIEEAVQEELNKSLDPADYTKDVSEEELESAVSGRVSCCTNEGTIHADGDGGGIAGIMGVDLQLDPEHDITTVTNRSTGAMMLEKAILDSCQNKGLVDVDGNYAGGIAGRMQMGIIYSCTGLGNIESEGDYAGGIAGFSGAAVKNCLSKSYIKARSYVGGITGSGEVLTGNRAMVRLKDPVQFFGSIAGNVTAVTSSKISDNIWCGGDIHAIDDVDYEGLAGWADFDTISLQEKSTFRLLRLVFLVDDEEVAALSVPYGGSLNENEIPQVPVRDGFYGTWDRTDFTDILTEDRIHAVYTRVVTLISSPMKRDGGNPVFFAEGSFAPGDILNATEMPAGEGEEHYLLTLPAGQKGEHVFRFLPAAGQDDVQIWLVKDGEREHLSGGTMGAYRTFSAEGREVEVFIVYSKAGWKQALYYVIPAGAGILLLIIIALAVRHAARHRKKKRKVKHVKHRRKRR